MDTQEKILLVVSAVALAAVIVFKMKPDLAQSVGLFPDPSIVGASVTPDTSDPNSGPWYLKWNMPYLFGPPVGMIAPPITEGQVGQDSYETAANDGWLPGRNW